MRQTRHSSSPSTNTFGNGQVYMQRVVPSSVCKTNRQSPDESQGACIFALSIVDMDPVSLTGVSTDPHADNTTGHVRTPIERSTITHSTVNSKRRSGRSRNEQDGESSFDNTIAIHIYSRIAIRKYLAFPAALIQGALAKLGLNATVTAESSGLPQCRYRSPLST